MKSIKWRSIFIIGITLFSLWKTIPTAIYFQLPASIRNDDEQFEKKLPSFLPKDHVKLGLDLQGGIQLKLGVNTKGSIESQLALRAVGLSRWAEKNKHSLKAYVKKGSQRITVTLEKDFDKTLRAQVAKEFPSLSVLSTDGKKVYYGYGQEEVKRIKKSALEKAEYLIRDRVNKLGAVEPIINRRADGSILVQLPGFTNSARAKDILGRTALLTFKIVDDDFKGFDKVEGKESEGIRKIVYGGESQPVFVSEDRDALKVLLSPHVPEDKELLFKKTAIGDGSDNRFNWSSFVVHAETSITGTDIKDARFHLVGGGQFNTGGPEVTLAFTGVGAKRFAEVTGQNVNKRMAIILDDVVESAPNINQKISGGSASITLGGNSNNPTVVKEGQELALILKSGAIPAEITVLEQREVGASLGPELADKGIKGVLIGLAFVIIFMLLYYRKPGMIACAALVLNGLFLLAIMANFGFALTLPGIAGFILTLGMAVDANVLINERIRQEIKEGKNARNSIRTGFEKVRWTIIDANVTTLIAALVLIETSGPGPIKGFAVTIMIGLIVSLFTSLFCSKLFFEVATRNISDDKLKGWLLGGAKELKKTTKFDFLRYGTPATFVACFLAFMVVLFAGTKGVNYGVDFIGGTQMTLHFEKEVEPGLLRDQAEKVGIDDIKVIALDGGKNNYQLRYDEDKGNALEELERLKKEGKSASAASSELFTAFKNSLVKDLADKKPEVQQVEFIGPQVGKELRNQGILSVLYAILAVLLYIAFRFDMRFGPGAVVKMFLDIFMLLGFYVFFGASFDLVAVAAFLTVVGYSVNDTIVIYDRIRESLASNPGLSLRDNINSSLNETLSRTINTSLTTVASLVGILCLGRGDIWYFAMAMTLGVIIATLSSTFVASSFILWLEEWRNNREKRA